MTVSVRLSELSKARRRDWLVRFGFGAGVSAFAAGVSAIAGAKAGGLFLAFPAVLLASLTLVAREDGTRQARDDARGATIGTFGMVAFGAGAAVLALRIPIWLAVVAACAAWTVVAGSGYLVVRRLGADGDEPADDSQGHDAQATR